jgi:hypothetical protein
MKIFIKISFSYPNRFGQQQVAGDFGGQFGQFYPGQFGAGGVGFPHQGAFGAQQFPFHGGSKLRIRKIQ